MRKFFSLLAAVLFAGSMMAAEVTVSKTVEELATANSWANGTVVTPFALDEVITVSTVATDVNTGKYYTSGQQVRLYQTGAAKLIVTAAEGYTISSITLTYASQNTGIFVEAESGVAVDFENVQSATFNVGNSGEATNGQARVTAISVTYNGEGGVTPPPADTYTVAGSDAAIFGEAWNPALAANDMTLADGVYTWTKAQLNLTAGTIEFKVVKNHSWDVASYPAQNYVLNIAEDGEYTITITFDPTTETVAAEAVKKVIPQYEVAEAIAAGLTDNTEILVRGVITKMEFKGKNFAKFGSVNIYVADATNAEGEFEFYNCYSLNADTFRTSTPAYDATSTAYAEFDEVADENGNAIHVGDTVIAFGKYKLYDTTHELNTGCYLTEIKHPGDAPVVEHTYTVAGAPAELFVAEWDPTLETNDMQPIVGSEYTHAWQKENVTLAAGKVEFKVVEDHDWANPAYPAYEAGNYELTISEAAIYTISIYFNETSKAIYAEALKTGEAPVVEEWAEIVFTEAVAAEDLAEDASFTLEVSEFAATITDPDNKMSIDANTARFGTVEAFKDYTLRLKTGGKSSSTKNFITLNIPEDGQLRIAVRTGSNAATDRNLVIVQGVDTLYNQVVKEEDKTVVPGEESSTNYYPYIIVDVNAGSVVLSYPTNGLNFYAFAFKAGEVVPPTPEHTYTVAGGSDVLFGTTWDPTNTANDMALVEGLYTWEKSELTLAAGSIGFKVCEDHAWTTAYPAQDYQLAIAEAGIYTITITFDPANDNTVNAVATKTGEAVVVPTVAMHGNFLGSWADTENFAIAQDNASASLTLTLAEGNYEFGMRIGGSGNWTANGANLTREANTTNLAEGSGNMHIAADVAGDYVFTYTYETQVLEVVYPEAPGEEINVTISSLTNPGQVLYADAIASYGYWDIYAYNDQYQIEISNTYTTEAAGTYTIDDLDAKYTYIVPAEGDTVHFTAGQVVLSITDGVVNVAGKLTGDDNNIYNINLTYKDPVAEQTVNVNIPKGVLYEGYATSGLYAVYGSAGDGTYVQLAIWAEAGFEGEFTEDDLDNQYVGSGLKDAAGNTQQIYTAAITVTPGAIEGAYTITADLLCYNNTLYKVTMKIGEEQGIEDVEAAVKAIKRLVNGQLVIEKAGKSYNMNGAVIR